jgi:hypothetical protein
MRDAMEGLEQEVLEQHKRYSPEILTCTRRESGHLLSLSNSGLATAHFKESYLLRRQEGLHSFLATRCSSYKKDMEWSLALLV